MAKRDYFEHVSIIGCNDGLTEVHAVSKRGKNWAVLLNEGEVSDVYDVNEPLNPKEELLEQHKQEELKRKISLREIVGTQKTRFDYFYSHHALHLLKKEGTPVYYLKKFFKTPGGTNMSWYHYDMMVVKEGQIRNVTSHFRTCFTASPKESGLVQYGWFPEELKGKGFLIREL